MIESGDDEENEDIEVGEDEWPEYYESLEDQEQEEFLEKAADLMNRKLSC